MKRLCFLLSLLAVTVSFAFAAADGSALYSKCKSCHGADGTKKALNVSAPLKGQSAADIEMKIKGYKDGTYGGSKKIIMAGQVKNLTAEEISALANYISSF
jgi:cytochrome c